MKRIIFTALILSVLQLNLFPQDTGSGKKLAAELKIDYPKHGYISALPATKWEESMITGNGTFGALVRGNPNNEIITLSHERLFLPEYPPTNAPDLGGNMDKIRELTLQGRGEEASVFAVKLGKEAGIEELIWTDPLVPACQIEIQSLKPDEVLSHARSVNYETGETTTAWTTDEGLFHRKSFISRPDNIFGLKLSSPDGIPINIKVRLTQLPSDDSELNSDLEDEFEGNELIENVSATVNNDGSLSYTTLFKKKWEGSLKGFIVEAKVFAGSGEIEEDNGWLIVEDADEVVILSKIKLSWELPIETTTGLDNYLNSSYGDLLKTHAAVQSEMFNRFSLKLGDNEHYMTSEELLETSTPGHLDKILVNALCEAARYELISSTGELPPSLQGIWGGTWRPAWSGDFTHNGNVPSAIASGYNTNFIEVMDAYTGYMFSMFDDFKDNAKDLYGYNGIFCPSRSSSSGKTYHYLDEYPHLFWYAGAAWFSQFFFDYWQYTGDTKFLNEKTIPFMLEGLAFYKDLLIKDESGKYIFVPSYSPEIGPLGHHPVAINATMDIAALKMLCRNIISLVKGGFIDSSYEETCKDMIENLPDYAIDSNGELKEWIYPGYENDNSHRHASHLLPLFYEVDPAFVDNPELVDAAKNAIESRMVYRRGKNGAEMAFGLVQKGLASAHIYDTEHAYECVDWLCNSYWSPALTSYHDPGRIFNTDISGGLPAVVTEMLVNSTAYVIELLPAIPKEWPDGEIKGVRARGGFVIDLVWENYKPVTVTVKSLLGKESTLKYKDVLNNIRLPKGESKTWEF